MISVGHIMEQVARDHSLLPPGNIFAQRRPEYARHMGRPKSPSSPENAREHDAC